VVALDKLRRRLDPMVRGATGLRLVLHNDQSMGFRHAGEAARAA